MQSRMDRYSTTKTSYKSRSEKNKNLYNDVKNSALTNFDVNSNVSVIGTNAKSIDVNKLSQILDQKYNDYAPKRKSIEVPAYEEPIIEKPLIETREYDINAILEKAKQGKNVDYNKARLKKVRDAQYEILNNLDLEIQKIDDAKKTSQRKEEEDNLMNLINTITQIELKNKEDYKNIDKDTAASLDLLSDLKEDTQEMTSDVKEEAVEEEKEEVVEPQKEITSEKPKQENKTVSEPEMPSHEEYVEKTLSKLNIDISSYDDFADVSKRDAGVIVIKIAIFAIIIGLVIGGIYVLNILLDLGLF